MPPRRGRNSVAEAAFATAARVNLRFDDDYISAEFFCCGLGFFRCAGNDAARNGNAEFFQNGFTLVFVDFHEFNDTGGNARVNERAVNVNARSLTLAFLPIELLRFFDQF